MNKPENPPAFPQPIDDMGTLTSVTAGMTLRDYFAAKALQGICAHPDTWGDGMKEIAANAYELADLMLEARSR